MGKIRAGIIFGGKSGEHEVSLASARSVMAAMSPEKYEIIPIGITHQGQWLLKGDPMALLSAGLETAEGTGASLAAMPTDARQLASQPGTSQDGLPRLDVIIPVLHGPFGEDGTIQGLLDLSDTPYVGCGVLASAVGMDKVACKAVFAAHGLPQVAYQAVKRSTWQRRPEDILDSIEAALPYPVFVKPANLGSSIGISKAQDRPALAAALAEAARYDRKLLVEQAVPYAREIECAVLGYEDPMASVPGEVIPNREFYDYAAKYIDGKSDLLIPAPIAPALAEQVRRLAVQAFLALDGSGLARVDFLMNGQTGEVFVNEVNTMPGFTSISMYPKLWEASGGPIQRVDRPAG